MKHLILHISFLCLALQAAALTIDERSATALNTVMLYGDSTFIIHSDHMYKEGAMFRILDETFYQHPDADQKQKFKWYHVETPDKRTGWIFGDGLAVYVKPQDLDSALRRMHRKPIQLGQGFENAMTWIASIQGRDNFHSEDYLNPLYSEYYLVVTNRRGKSVLMKCAGESVRGETELRRLEAKDITGDGIPEFIVQRNTVGVGSSIDDRELEIFTIKAGTLVSVFLDHSSLSYDTNIPSPALYKFVEIEQQSIRVTYIDYPTCKDYSQMYPTDARYPRQERCIEYVTEYYNWDKKSKSYKQLYGETRLATEGGVRQSGVAIKQYPLDKSKTLGYVSLSERIVIVKHFEEYLVDGGKKKLRNWFYVQKPDGKAGYIHADEAGFVDVEHAGLLNQYYLSPPLSKQNWKTDGDAFLSILD